DVEIQLTDNALSIKNGMASLLIVVSTITGSVPPKTIYTVEKQTSKVLVAQTKSAVNAATHLGTKVAPTLAKQGALKAKQLANQGAKTSKSTSQVIKEQNTVNQ